MESEKNLGIADTWGDLRARVWGLGLRVMESEKNLDIADTWGDLRARVWGLALSWRASKGYSLGA
jgi:hypothetical protein